MLAGSIASRMGRVHVGITGDKIFETAVTRFFIMALALSHGTSKMEFQRSMSGWGRECTKFNVWWARMTFKAKMLTSLQKRQSDYL